MSLCFCSTPSAQRLEPALQALIPQPCSKSIQFQRPRRTSSISPTHAVEVQAVARRAKAPHRTHFQTLVNPAGRGSLAGLFAGSQGWNSRKHWQSQVKTYQESWNTPLGDTLVFMALVKSQTLLQHPYSADTTLALSYSCRGKKRSHAAR